MNKFFICITTTLIFTSCASNTFKEKTYRNMLIASAIGTLAAQSEKHHKLGYAVAYAGTAAAVAAIASIEYYDLDKEKRELQAKLKFINDIETQKSKNISSDMPEDLKNLVDTHHYDVYRINRWTQRGPKLLVKESEAIELKEVKSNEE